MSSRRLRTLEVVAWWAVVSLLAVSFAGDHTVVTVAVAIVGGAAVGAWSVFKSPAR